MSSFGSFGSFGSIASDLAYIYGYERELKKRAWEDELDVKVEEYFGTHVILSLSEGRIRSITDLKLTLTQSELSGIMPVLRQACLDYEVLNRQKDNPAGTFVAGYKYPRQVYFGNSHIERRYGIIQILV